jgi:hypothetical protein
VAEPLLRRRPAAARILLKANEIAIFSSLGGGTAATRRLSPGIMTTPLTPSLSATTRRMATLLAVLVFPALGIADTNAAASVSGYAWNDGGTTDLISSNLPNSKLMKLNLTAPLEDVTVELIVAGTSGMGTEKTKIQQIQKINAKQTEYRGGSYPHGVPIVAISDPNTKKTYVFSRGHTIFFISDKSGMIGCAYVAREFVLKKSYVEIPTASGGEEAAIARFAAQFDDAKLAQANKNPDRVSGRLRAGQTDNQGV